MADKTDFLGLTLPLFGEFNNSWNDPVNQNFELIDDQFEKLDTKLGDPDVLKGTLTSLADRLAVSIAADGTIDISTSPDLLDLATSQTDGDASPLSARDRFTRSDFEIFDARTPFSADRYTVGVATIPDTSTPYPKATIENAVAFQSRDFGAESGMPLASPNAPFAEGIAQAAGSLITASAIDTFRINGLTQPAIFNIDGYMFRIREDLDVEFQAALSASNNEYVWIYLERIEASYGTGGFSYDGVLNKDLRELKSGIAGTVSGTKIFSQTDVLFQDLPGKVEPGDVLEITTVGDFQGFYVIDELDQGGSPNTLLTIKGNFPGTVPTGGLAWRILDAQSPHVGATIPSSNPTDENQMPDYVAGRVYIGRVKANPGNSPTDATTFRPNGVYDTGWLINQVAGNWNTSPVTIDHEMGTIPSRVEIWVRTGGTIENAYRPQVRRQIVTDGATTADLWLPSLMYFSSTTDVTIKVDNASTTPSKPHAFFTQEDGVTEVTTADVRVIIWR